MNRRSSFAFILVAMLSMPSLAWAQGQGNGNAGQNSGNGQGNAGGNGNSGNNGNNGNSGQGNSSAVPGNAAGGMNVPGPQQPGVAGGASGNAAPAAPAGDSGAGLSESEVLAAVEAGRAVPLATIMPDVRDRIGGEIIDARLQQVGGFLVYAVTVLTPGGRVTTEYYYARSGIHVER